MNRPLCLSLLAVALLATLLATSPTEAEESFEGGPLLTKYCFGCHGKRWKKGDLNLEAALNSHSACPGSFFSDL